MMIAKEEMTVHALVLGIVGVPVEEASVVDETIETKSAKGNVVVHNGAVITTVIVVPSGPDVKIVVNAIQT